MTVPSFLDTKERSNTTDYMLITATNSLYPVLAHKQKLSAILSPCIHLSFLICVLFFCPLAIWWHIHFSITLPWHHWQTLLFLFSPTSSLFIQHISKFCYFFLFLSLKAVTSFLFLKTKIPILAFLCTTACPLLKIYSVVKPHKLANNVPIFHSRWLHILH